MLNSRFLTGVNRGNGGWAVAARERRVREESSPKQIPELLVFFRGKRAAFRVFRVFRGSSPAALRGAIPVDHQIGCIMVEVWQASL